jgi:hypothetical protein
MSDEYSAAADWAERDMTLPQNSTSARRGQEAGDFDHDLLVMSGGQPFGVRAFPNTERSSRLGAWTVEQMRRSRSWRMPSQWQER